MSSAEVKLTSCSTGRKQACFDYRSQRRFLKYGCVPDRYNCSSKEGTTFLHCLGSLLYHMSELSDIILLDQPGPALCY